MLNPDQIRARLEQLLAQTPFNGLSADMKLMLQSQLSSLLNKANLVGREEFEVQADALRRAQEKLAQLELKIQELENRS